MFSKEANKHSLNNKRTSIVAQYCYEISRSFDCRCQAEYHLEKVTNSIRPRGPLRGLSAGPTLRVNTNVSVFCSLRQGHTVNVRRISWPRSSLSSAMYLWRYHDHYFYYYYHYYHPVYYYYNDDNYSKV